MDGGSAAEVALGLLLIRLILPVSILAATIWAHIRISTALRNRLELPADMKAQISAFKHQVSELEETFNRHIGKDNARWKLMQKEVEQQANGEVVGSMANAAVASAGSPKVPRQVWDSASQAQRMAWQGAGMEPEAKAS